MKRSLLWSTGTDSPGIEKMQRDLISMMVLLLPAHGWRSSTSRNMMAAQEVWRREELCACAPWEAPLLPSWWCPGDVKSTTSAWTAVSAPLASMGSHLPYNHTWNTHASGLLRNKPGMLWSHIIARMHIQIHFKQYVSSSTQKAQHDTGITNSFFLDQLIPLYLFKQCKILLYTEQYLLNWQDYFRHAV